MVGGARRRPGSPRSLCLVFDARGGSEMNGQGWLSDQDAARGAEAPRPRETWLDRVRSGERLANGAIVVILALFLLPLVVGPFVAAWEFAANGQYAGALFIASLFACLALVAIRAVQRGEFGPGVFFLAVGLLVGAVILGAVLSRLVAESVRN